MPSNNVKAPFAEQFGDSRGEGTDSNTYEGKESVSTISHTKNINEGILAWVTELTEIRERVLNDRITSLEDPRAQRIADEWAAPGTDLSLYFGDEDHVLEEIYWLHFTEKPACPLAAPTWADHSTVSFGEWPEITVQHAATVPLRFHVNSYVGVRSMDVIFADRVDDRDGQVWEPGQVDADNSPDFLVHDGSKAAEFDFTGTDDLNILGEAILDLARQIDQAGKHLTRRTEPGAPSLEERL